MPLLRIAGGQLGSPRAALHRIQKERGAMWIHHIKRLRQRYEFAANRLEGVSRCRVKPAQRRETIQAAETCRWKVRLKTTLSLRLYLTGKKAIEKEICFGNSRGTVVFAKAFIIRNRVWRAKFMKGQERACSLPGVTDEATEPWYYDANVSLRSLRRQLCRSCWVSVSAAKNRKRQRAWIIKRNERSGNMKTFT